MRVAKPSERPIDPARRTRRGRPAFRMSSGGKGDAVLKCQSRLEWLFAMAAVIHPRVSEIYYQPLVVNLTTGTVHREKIKMKPECKYYVPDYLLVVDGKEYIIEVKSAALLAMSNKDFESIREILARHALRFALLTDLDLRSAENNIRILYEYAIHDDPSSITAWADALGNLLENSSHISVAQDLVGLIDPINWYVCAGILRGVIKFDIFNWQLLGMNFPVERAFGDQQSLEVMHFV